MSVRLFGIRHHGPGCARSLASALASFAPDVVLIEGPPDAQEALAHVAHADLRPPVALLVHSVEDPRRAVFYPFTTFSPEWQAMQYGATHGVPTRFIDLPCAHHLPPGDAPETKEANPTDDGQTPSPSGDAETDESASSDEASAADKSETSLYEDPIGMLAEAAGFVDREQWWDSQVEQRTDAAGLFDAIAEAMTTLRSCSTKPLRKHEARREAHMRHSIRKAQKESFQRIAVVCGAWHVPALGDSLLGDRAVIKADAELLKGLPKEKVASTWIPWTNSRLAFASGYGAGVESPGFYAHVWEHQAKAPLVWCVLAARLLRGADLDASSASVIETVRLAETLAVLRELPAPGLSELREAILAVLCRGDALQLSLIRKRLEIGEQLGSVPEHVDAVPVQRDFEREVKRLRLKLSTEQVTLELDLRKDMDGDRSRLLHRLRILGIEWGKVASVGRGTGTFKEGWTLAWNPELIVDLVAANLYGNTVTEAARGRLEERAAGADVAELARLIEVARLADLPHANSGLLAALDKRAASTGDVRVLLDATEPLARLLRYGDVRAGADEAQVIMPVFRALVERALVGLLPACTQLDDDAAASLLTSLERAHAALLLLDATTLKEDWFAELGKLHASEASHPRLRGRVVRLLLEQGKLPTEELSRLTSLALSVGADPAASARWLEGLIAGEGMFLVHHDTLLTILDEWLSQLSQDSFQTQLPLLRRAFSDFAAAERRALAQKLKAGKSPVHTNVLPLDYDAERAALVMPVLADVLGVPL